MNNGPFYPLSSLLTQTQHLQLEQHQKQIKQRMKQGESELQTHPSSSVESNEQKEVRSSPAGQELSTDESKKTPSIVKASAPSSKPFMPFGKRRCLAAEQKLADTLQQIEKQSAFHGKILSTIQMIQLNNPMWNGPPSQIPNHDMIQRSSLHTTKCLLGEIAAFQQTITNCEAVELYNGNSNFVTICAVAIPRNKDEKAFEAYHCHSPYVAKLWSK